MSRQKYEKTFNTFTKGLMTEASELNFPEDFSLYEKNFLLHRDGGRDRRKGMELIYPLGLVLTSKPYELESQESLSVWAEASRVYDHISLKTTSGQESLGTGANVSRLMLRATLLDSDIGQESAGISGGVSRLNLRSNLNEHEGTPGDIGMSANVEGLYLHSPLVFYTQTDPEEVSMGASVERIYLNEN